MGRLLVDHDDVHITIAIQISDNDLSGGSTISSEVLVLGDGTESAIQVVVQQLIGAVGVDAEDIQIAIVIGIEHRPVHGVVAPAISPGRFGDITPDIRLDLPPELIRPIAKQIHIGQAVIVEISPERGVDGADGGENVRLVEAKGTVTPVDKHRVVDIITMPQRIGDENIDSTIAIDITGGDGNGPPAIFIIPGVGITIVQKF